MSDGYKEILKTDVLRTLKIARRVPGYDSRLINDHIGKHITKTLLDTYSLDSNLQLLKELSSLQFKPLFIEKVE